MRPSFTTLAVGLFAVFAVTAPAALAPPTLHATVGLRTIKLTNANGQPVGNLRARVYRVRVTDRSRIRNFHLKGPTGTVDRKTALAFVGKKAWTVRFTKGSYLFYSDKGRLQRGTFRVN